MIPVHSSLVHLDYELLSIISKFKNSKMKKLNTIGKINVILDLGISIMKNNNSKDEKKKVSSVNKYKPRKGYKYCDGFILSNITQTNLKFLFHENIRLDNKNLPKAIITPPHWNA